MSGAGGGGRGRRGVQFAAALAVERRDRSAQVLILFRRVMFISMYLLYFIISAPVLSSVIITALDQSINTERALD